MCNVSSSLYFFFILFIYDICVFDDILYMVRFYGQVVQTTLYDGTQKFSWEGGEIVRAVGMHLLLLLLLLQVINDFISLR